MSYLKQVLLVGMGNILLANSVDTFATQDVLDKASGCVVRDTTLKNAGNCRMMRL